MNRNLRLLLVTLLCTGVLTKDKICEHVGFGQANYHHGATAPQFDEQAVPTPSQSADDYFVNDSLYRWDEYMLDWVPEEVNEDWSSTATSQENPYDDDSDLPIEIDWELLTDIRYRLRYFEEIGAEMFAPVFSESLRALDGRNVTVKGHIIPLDDEGKTLSLSQDSYASCFFCGKASPASIITLHLQKEDKRPKLDEVRTYKGYLHLNQDDPNEFYYILKDAEVD